MKEPEGVNINHEPNSRLTAKCAEMTAVLEDDDKDESIKAIVLLEDPESYGMQLRGYDSKNDDEVLDAVTHLMMSAKVLLNSIGRDMALAGIQDPRNN